MKRAIGASYLIDQRAGGEQVGGCEVTLRYPVGETGTIHIQNSLHGTQETRDDIDGFTTEARKGVIDCAAEHQIDLAKFDVTIAHFFIHDVDSRPFLYYLAGRNAFQSALAAWYPPSQFNIPRTRSS